MGREQETRELESMLAIHRLVTVIGPGGTGKTRFAVEVARRLAERFADGAWFVELAQIDDPALVPTALAATLGVPDSLNRTVTDALAAVLRHRHTLLVLDNCEHVAEAAAQVCERLLRECEDVRVLATSRQLLGVPGEAQVLLRPLPTPPIGFEPAELNAYDGAVLFVHRAQLANPSFTADDAGPRAVADIVRRLDGAPLAIELAAAQLDVMDVASLSERLADRFELLVNPGRSETSRQASLGACVDWSYSRLESVDQAAFQALSVFPAPFTVAAASAVVGADARRTLERLVRRCMVTPPRTGDDGELRFGMLETLRAYAAARLAEGDRAEGARAAAARWLAEEADRVTVGFETGPTELRAAAWMDAEGDSLRESLLWAKTHDRPLALRLTVAMAPWWALRGRYREARAHLKELCAGMSDPRDLLEKAHVWIGWTSMHCSDFEDCVEHCDLVIDSYVGREPSRELVDAYNCVAGSHLNRDRLAAARNAGERGRDLARAIGYPTGEAFGCVVLSAIGVYAGDPASTLEWALAAAEPDAAAISGFTDRWRRQTLGSGLHDTGDLIAADNVLRELVALCRQAGDKFMEAGALVILAEGSLKTGQDDEGRLFAIGALTIFAEINDRLMLTDAFRVAAHYGVAHRPTDAAQLLAAREACLDGLGVGPNIHDDAHVASVTELIAQACSPEQIATARDKGLAMSTDEAVRLAHSLLEAVPSAAAADGRSLLSARERELLALLAEGLTDVEIGQKLFISVRTVRSHLDRIRDKTGRRRRAELTRLALGMQDPTGTGP